MTADLLRLRPYQAKALDTIETELLHGDQQRFAAVLPTGAGKGHTPDTEVPTPDGLRKWGDLRPGDYVFGSDGSPTRVVAVYDRGVIPTFQVTFSDGASVVVDGEHLWKVTDRGHGRAPFRTKVLSTSEIADTGLITSRGRRFAVPLAAAVQRPSADLPIDPYTLGSLIANGSMTGRGVTLTTSDPQVIERVRAAHPANDTNFTVPRPSKTLYMTGMMPVIRSMGLDVRSAEKHIPTVYLESSVDDRVALLQGLMDGDGSSHTDRRAVSYHTTSPRLADDVVELVTSLGGTASHNWYERRFAGRPTVTAGVVSIHLPKHIAAFSTDRRRKPGPSVQGRDPSRAIVGIEPAGDQPITCIRVDAEDHLYLVTRHHIVTHNTVLFAHLSKMWEGHYADRLALPKRVLVLVHRDELVTQAVGKLRQVMPHKTVGVVKAELNDTDHDVIVASVQTLGREHRRVQLPPVGLVICDEAHHASSPTWRAVMAHVGCYRPGGASAVGFTATMARGDGRGLGDVWGSVVFRCDVLDLIEMGHLVDVSGRRVTVDGLTFENVAKRGGDFAPTSLSEALRSSDAMRVTADAYLEYARDRSGVVFTPDVASAQAFAEEFRSRGLVTEAVWGAMPTERRRDVLRRFMTGEIQVVTNANVLTEGWDAPIASCCVMARPTLSPVLYVQAVGRVLRPHPGKTDALVLDVAGASEMHQLATLADLSSRRLDEVIEGESLTEAVRRERERGNPHLSEYVVDSYEVDLFRRSEALWLQTKAGVWFTTTKDQLYFLWPGSEPDLYKAGKRPIRGAGGGWIAEDVDFGTAQGWCEQEALADDAANKADGGASLALKNASWRRGRTPASPQQMTKLERLGVTPREGVTKREASDLISVELASRVLDQAIAGRK